jgi:hypothetical protein
MRSVRQGADANDSVHSAGRGHYDAADRRFPVQKVAFGSLEHLRLFSGKAAMEASHRLPPPLTLAVDFRK